MYSIYVSVVYERSDFMGWIFFILNSRIPEEFAGLGEDDSRFGNAVC